MAEPVISMHGHLRPVNRCRDCRPLIVLGFILISIGLFIVAVVRSAVGVVAVIGAISFSVCGHVK